MSEHQEIIDELWNEYHDMYSIQHAATPKEINELRDSIEELFSDDLFMSNINKDELAQLEELYMRTFSENCVEEEAEEPNAKPSLTYLVQLLGILLGASCMAIIVWLFMVITILAFGG